MSSHFAYYSQHGYTAEVTDVVVDFADDKAERLTVRLLVSNQILAFLEVLDFPDTFAHILCQ